LTRVLPRTSIGRLQNKEITLIQGLFRKNLSLFVTSFFLISLSTLASAASQAPKEKKMIPVAVTELQIREGVTKGKAGLLTDILRSELIGTNLFIVMSRDDQDAILKELAFQASGACDSTSCLVEMGQALGIEKMIGGSVGKLGRKYAITVKMIDIKTSRNEKQFTEYYLGAEENLDEAIRAVALKLSGLQPASSKGKRRRRAPRRRPAERISSGGRSSSPAVAGLLSLVIPGAGQLYNGQSVLKSMFMGSAGIATTAVWLLNNGYANESQTEYNSFDGVTGLDEKEGTGISNFEFWEMEYQNERQTAIVFMGLRGAMTLYSVIDAMVYSSKYGSQARVPTKRPVMEMAWHRGTPVLAFNLSWGGSAGN